MFGILKKEFELIAPIDGMVIPLSEVKDPVFAEKMAGDGVAVDPSGDIIKAPASGKLSLVFRTNHALGMILPNGIELLVHIGIDTVQLDGKGFERLVEEGTDVKVGDPLIKIDKKFIESKGYSLVTPVLITNTSILKDIEYKTGFNAVSGKDVILNYKTK